LRLQRLGYNSAYIRIPLAAGLATDSLAGHVGQRIRWARGMSQIFRLDNPLFGKGLALPQRLCYFNSMLHFFSGIPRLIFFVTPAAFLIMNAYIVYASGIMILLYAMPHIVHAVLTNNRIQGKYRHFLWNEIYETVIAWYIAIPTTIALIIPSKGTFNVTAKGDLMGEEHVDWSIARPYLILLGINLAGLIAALFRITLDPTATVLAVLITVVWTIYNIIILGGALGVSIEAKQIRRSPRLSFIMPASIMRADGRIFPCTVRDYSDKGFGVQMEIADLIPAGEEITIILIQREEEFAFPGTTMFSLNNIVGIQLHELSLQQNIDLIQCTFARAEVWALWQDEFAQDKPLQSMKDIFILGLKGYYHILQYSPRAIRTLLQGIMYILVFIGSFIPRKPKLINN
jgi:cellulose synthase (UDP-forming)